MMPPALVPLTISLIALRAAALDAPRAQPGMPLRSAGGWGSDSDGSRQLASQEREYATSRRPTAEPGALPKVELFTPRYLAEHWWPPPASNRTAEQAPLGWLMGLARMPRSARVHSQGNQDGVLAFLFSHIGVTNRQCVEFGYQGLAGANTGMLQSKGFRCLLLDADNEDEATNLHAHALHSSNVVGLLQRYGVPREPDYLSCDMDSHDAFVLRAILDAGYRPRVISTEYNANMGAWATLAQADPKSMPHSPPLASERGRFRFVGCMWGVSAGASRLMAEEFGYTIVARVGRLDLFWVRNDLLRAQPVPRWVDIAPPADPRAFHTPALGQDLLRLVDYAVWKNTEDLQLARAAALRTLRAHFRRHECFSSALDEIARAEESGGEGAIPPLGPEQLRGRVPYDKFAHRKLYFGTDPP